MEGNKGFEHCSDVLKKKGAWFVQQKDNVRPENCQLAVWTDIVLLPLHPWGEMIRMDRENNPPTAVLTSELMKSIGIMASFWGPKKNTPDASYRFQLTLPFHWRGGVLKGILSEWYIFTYLGKPTQPFFIGKSARYMFFKLYVYDGPFFFWRIPRVGSTLPQGSIYGIYIYMATVVKPWKNQTKTVGWIGSTNPFYIGFIILYQAIIRREYTTHSHPEASSEMECAICVYIGFVILSQGMK